MDKSKGIPAHQTCLKFEKKEESNPTFTQKK
jgi:hypothetical protein